MRACHTLGTRLVLVATVFFGSSGCELFFPVGDYAGRWCDTQPRTLTACADFDDGKLEGPGRGPVSTLAGGAVVADDSRSTSPPFSFTATMPGLASQVVGSATLPITLTKGASHVHCEFDLFIPDTPDEAGSPEGLSFPIQGGHYAVRLVITGTAVNFHSFTVDNSGAGTDMGNVQATGGVRAGWNRIGVDVTVGVDGGMGTLSAAFDGTPVVVPTPIPLTNTIPTQPVVLVLGILNPKGPTNPAQFGFDDIACTAE